MDKLQPGELELWASLIRDKTGIHIEPAKAYLFSNRLRPVLKKYGHPNLMVLHQRVMDDPHGPEAEDVIHAISTHETSFFRDSHPFLFLDHYICTNWLADLRSGSRPALRMWSAGCSTGQESYSMAMVARDQQGRDPCWKASIFANDISGPAIEHACRGIYRDEDVAVFEPVELKRHFTRIGSLWQVADEIKRLVAFEKLRLSAAFEGQGMFDVIFCRNVAIYFQPERRARLFDRFAEHLAPDGIMVVGISESLWGVSARFKRENHKGFIYYRLK